jgi:hypothetical protein
MKRLIVVAAMAVAGCSATKHEAAAESPLPPGYVALATFTGEADLQAGTLTIQTTPVPAASVAGMKAITVLDADVTVANKVVSGNPFSNVAQGAGRLCTVSPPFTGNVWGATVTITNRLTDTMLGGVYAEITSFNGATGQESCSSAAAPPDLSATNGLWSYPQIVASGTGEKDWVFKFASSSKFTFGGRIIGVKITKGDWTGASLSAATQRPVNNKSTVTYSWQDDPTTAIADAGTYIAVANNPGSGSFGIDFVNKTTGAYVSTVNTPAKVTSLAAGGTRLWFGTVGDTGSRFYVGYVNADGTGSATSDQAGALVTSATHPVKAIVADPTDATKAWVLWFDGTADAYVARYTPGSGLGTETAIGGPAYSMLVGTDNRLYVAVSSGSTIDAYTLGTGTAVLDASYGSDPCYSPWAIVQRRSGGDMYFTSTSENLAGQKRTCRITTGGAVTEVGSVTSSRYPRNIAVNAAGRVWNATGDGNELFELDTRGTTNNITVTTGTNLTPLTLDSNGALWYADGSGLWKISP